MPQSFSLYDLKNISNSRRPKRLDDPRFERLVLRRPGYDGRIFSLQVAGHAADGVADAHVPEGVGWLERVVEEAVLVVDAREAIDHVVVAADDFEPNVVDAAIVD